MAFNSIMCGRGPSSFVRLSRSMSSLSMQPMHVVSSPMQVTPPVHYAPPQNMRAPSEISLVQAPLVQDVVSKSINPEEFAQMSPIERIQAIFEIHGDKAAQLASMQKTSGVIMHLIHTAGVSMPVLFFDTQYLFQETIDLKNEFAERYDLNIVTITPQLNPKQQNRLYGTDLWKTRAGQVQCCYMRKEQPLMQTIENMGIQATLSGLMQKEGGARSSVQPIDIDSRTDTTVYNPLFDWTNKEIHEYTKKHDIPVHKLYAKQFLSIGCAPCTTAVKPGEHPRAGRWRHLRKDGSLNDSAYCGMNHTDVGKKNEHQSKAKKKIVFGSKKEILLRSQT